MKLVQTLSLFAATGLATMAGRAAAARNDSDPSTLRLNVTAIGAQDGASTLECWQVDSPFDISTDPGTAGSAVASLGNVANMSYTIIPSNYDGGVHNAPHNQWVAFVSGLAYITLPHSNSSTAGAHVSGGEFGLIFAADTAGVSTTGHRTEYPGITETVLLQVPTVDGGVPAHAVLHTGPCTAQEITGTRGLAAGGGGAE